MRPDDQFLMAFFAVGGAWAACIMLAICLEALAITLRAWWRRQQHKPQPIEHFFDTSECPDCGEVHWRGAWRKHDPLHHIFLMRCGGCGAGFIVDKSVKSITRVT